MHKSQITRAIAEITKLLMRYGLTENQAIGRARNIISVGTTGEKITPSVANEMLTPTPVIKGIPDNKTRCEVSIEVSRHWIACTSNSASSAWMRLHLQLGMTRYKSAEWLCRNRYVDYKIRDCLREWGYRDAKYHGKLLDQCISKLQKSMQSLKDLS